MRIPEPLREPATRARLLVGLAVAAFLIAAALDVGELDYNFDEGVYVFQARDMVAGRLPMRDFFVHQPPLYPAMLAALSFAGADTLPGARFLSALFWCAATLALFRLARERLSPSASALAAAVMLFSPLALGFGRAALPNASMVALSVTAMLLAVRGERVRSVAAAGLLLTLAILLKPLALATAGALALWLALGRRWRALGALAATGALATAASWIALDLIGAGGFTELIRQQLVRFRTLQGFELFRRYQPFLRLTEARGWHTQLAWNLAEHRRALGSLLPGRGADSNGLLLLGALAALSTWAWLDAARRRLVGLCLLWLGTALTLNLLVWGPVWNHYFLQYLPPLSLLSAVGVEALGRRAARRPRLAALPALAFCAALVANGLYARAQLRLDPRRWAPLAPPGSVWLTFDPTLHLISGTRPACGIYDPFNVYGDAALAAQPGSRATAFTRSYADLLACLEADPRIRIFVTFWTTWFLDDDRRVELARRFPGRVFFQDPRERRRVEDLVRRLER